jgi:hypothetical protein
MNKQVKKILLAAGLLNALIGVQAVAATSATASIVNVYVQYVSGTAFVARTMGQEYGVMTAGGVYGLDYFGNWHIPVGGRICTIVQGGPWANKTLFIYQVESATHWAKIAYWGTYTYPQTRASGPVKYIGKTYFMPSVETADLVVENACLNWGR